MYYSFGPFYGFKFHLTEEEARSATEAEVKIAAETAVEPLSPEIMAISWGAVMERVSVADAPSQVGETPNAPLGHGIPISELNGLLADSATDFLTKENKSLREAGFDLASAAVEVARNYDGVHRLLLAVSDWFRAVANEGGRGDMHRSSYP